MAVTPDTKHSIVVYKTMDYRGGSKRWSNRYHFEGDLPTSQAAWEAFSDLIVASEKTIFPTGTQIVETVGYDAGSATPTNPHGDAVFTKIYATAGTLSPAGTDTLCPGDCVAFLRFGTPARSTKNHPVYLSNYFHVVYRAASAPDTLSATQKGAIEGYADAWLTGFVADGSHRERCGPRGAVATSRLCSPVIRHRDFPS